MKTKGVHVERKLDKIGMWSSDTAQIFFDEVRIPQKNVIGKTWKNQKTPWNNTHVQGDRGKGFLYQMQQFQQERLWVAVNVLLVSISSCWSL